MRSSSASCEGKQSTDFEQTKAGESNSSHCQGTLYLVGIGPGNQLEMTEHALNVLSSSEYWVGYKTYLELLSPELAQGKQLVSTGMTGEVERCREAIKLALAGKRVSLISGGDAGIYGMAGLAMEILAAENLLSSLRLEVIPGVSAAQAGAAVLGAPLMNDFVVLSLSDLMTPWDKIAKRAEAAALGGFVTVIYNPRSVKRRQHLDKVQELFLKYRAPETLVGIVKNALRPGQQKIISTLADFTDEEIDMLSVVIIGNEDTKLLGDYLVTVRGYQL